MTRLTSSVIRGSVGIHLRAHHSGQFAHVHVPTCLKFPPLEQDFRILRAGAAQSIVKPTDFTQRLKCKLVILTMDQWLHQRTSIAFPIHHTIQSIVRTPLALFISHLSRMRHTKLPCVFALSAPSCTTSAPPLCDRYSFHPSFSNIHNYYTLRVSLSIDK